jgi:hypothetical protein
MSQNLKKIKHVKNYILDNFVQHIWNVGVTDMKYLVLFKKISQTHVFE